MPKDEGRARKSLPARDLLNELLRFDPDSGKLFWRPRDPALFRADAPGRTKHHSAAIWNSRFAGKEALIHVADAGCLYGRIFGISYRAHRIIWKMVYGDEPDEIDHRDGNPANNRLTNLRAVDHSGNMRNVKLRGDSTSGHVGVSQMENGSWRAYVCGRHLGSFATREQAIAARVQAQKGLGFGPRHGGG